MKQFSEFVKKYNLNTSNVKKYIDFLCSYLNSNQCNNVIKWLYDNKIDFNYIIKYLDTNNKPVYYNNIVYFLIYTRQDDIVINYFDYFVKNNHKLLELKNILKYTKKIELDLNEIIDKNPKLIVEEIVSEKIKLSLTDLNNEKIFDFLNQIIIELLRYENKDYHDIKFVGSGAFSSVFQIGNHVLKIGKERKTFSIKNHKRFLKPLYRKNIYSLNEEFLFCIEITQKVDRNDITKEDVYNIYKELREDGLIWVDPSIANLGRLVRDNEIYFDDIEFVDKESTGYLTDNDEVLKKGEIVILDNDYIYDEKDFFNSSDYNPFICESYQKYEARYRKEKSEINKKK